LYQKKGIDKTTSRFKWKQSSGIRMGKNVSFKKQLTNNKEVKNAIQNSLRSDYSPLRNATHNP